MINKMSGCDETICRNLKFNDSSTNEASSALHVQKTSIRSNQATMIIPETEKEPPSDAVYKTQQFSWPLGDKNSKEELKCQIPMDLIKKASKKHKKRNFWLHMYQFQYQQYQDPV